MIKVEGNIREVTGSFYYALFHLLIEIDYYSNKIFNLSYLILKAKHQKFDPIRNFMKMLAEVFDEEGREYMLEEYLNIIQT